jgi:hypothetical protein
VTREPRQRDASRALPLEGVCLPIADSLGEAEAAGQGEPQSGYPTIAGRYFSNPVVSGIPNMMFMFCSAWPEAPFMMLSSVETAITG